MEQVLTLVAPKSIHDDDIFAVLGETVSLSRLGDRAVDVLSGPLNPGAIKLAHEAGWDAAITPSEGRKKSILICDMDSTVIGQECLDELADLAGFGAEIAAVTERAMRGELDFEEALTSRVSKLTGLSTSAVDDVLDTRLTLSPGAETLVKTMRSNGVLTALVSGGFTVFTGPIAERARFERNHGNTLDIAADQTFTGKVVPPILGKEAKREALIALAEEKGVDPSNSLAMGDGANDLEMIDLAGLGIAYKAKPVVADAADAAIIHTDLTAALYYQGYREDEFAR